MTTTLNEYFAPQPTSAAELPDPVPLLRSLTQGALEVLAGVREVDQLARWFSEDAFRALVTRANLSARARSARLMIGGITGSNIESLRFHERLGYAEWGRIPAAGRKFGEWHDLVLMGLDLQP